MFNGFGNHQISTAVSGAVVLHIPKESVSNWESMIDHQPDEALDLRWDWQPEKAVKRFLWLLHSSQSPFVELEAKLFSSPELGLV